MTNEESWIVPCARVYSGHLDADPVLFCARDRRLHLLNRTAGELWSAFAGGASAQRVVSMLASAHRLPPETITADVLDGVSDLEALGVCHVDEPCEHSAEAVADPAQPPLRADGDTIGRIDAQPIADIRALGVPLVVETNDALLRAELARVFAPLRAIDADEAGGQEALQHIVVEASDNRWRVMRNGATTSVRSTREEAIRSVVAECNTAPLAHVDDAVVFHAAVADLGLGNVLFPGVSNAGKSTLVAQLVTRGHRYVTDEAAAVDLGSLDVRPFTKSICLEAGAYELFDDMLPSRRSQSCDVDPRDLGPGRLGSGGPIVAAVFATFDRSASPSIRSLDRATALRRLLANAFVFDHVGARGFDALLAMVHAFPCYELVHPGGTWHLDLLEQRFGARTSVTL